VEEEEEEEEGFFSEPLASLIRLSIISSLQRRKRPETTEKTPGTDQGVPQ